MKIIQVILITLSVLTLNGCAYFTNRAHDAADIFTFTAGHGAGVVAQVGPLHTGLGIMADNVGIRDGEVIMDNNYLSTMQQSMTSEVIILGVNKFDGNIKGFTTSNIAMAFPVAEDNKAKWTYYTRVDIGAAAIVGVRFGINFGEMVDFMLGLFCIDIVDDDNR